MLCVKFIAAGQKIYQYLHFIMKQLVSIVSHEEQANTKLTNENMVSLCLIEAAYALYCNGISSSYIRCLIITSWAERDLICMSKCTKTPVFLVSSVRLSRQ